MARVLIVGCGCRGRTLAAELDRRGHSVRGTTRRVAGLHEIRACGADAGLADPERLATLVPHLEAVSVVCWLMGRVDEEALHGGRLETLLEHLVDTPVRGFVHEAHERHPAGREIVQRAAERYRMPALSVDYDEGSLEAVVAAVSRILEPGSGLPAG